MTINITKQTQSSCLIAPVTRKMESPGPQSRTTILQTQSGDKRNGLQYLALKKKIEGCILPSSIGKETTVQS